jgi:hypothetical protein
MSEKMDLFIPLVPQELLRLTASQHSRESWSHPQADQEAPGLLLQAEMHR